jgi:cbb3-type cytochrome oxidase maturation protein
MESLYILIPLSLVVVFLIAVIFWWSLRSGQYEDMEGPGYRILMDDDNPPIRLEDRTGPGAIDNSQGDKSDRPT